MATIATHRRPGFWLQLGLTLLTSAFIAIPMGYSVLAGLMRNAFIGLRSGLTLDWVDQVLSLYWPTILLSVEIALLCVVATLLIGGSLYLVALVVMATSPIARPGGADFRSALGMNLRLTKAHENHVEQALPPVHRRLTLIHEPWPAPPTACASRPAAP